MHVPWFFLTLSTLATFSILLLLVRLIGSTQLTQLTFFNWVAGASMGNVAANMLTAVDTSTWLSNAFTLVVFSLAAVVAALVALKSREFRRVTNGEPVVLIHKGAMIRSNLRRTKVNVDVLLMLLREKGYFSYTDIEYAILEPTGNLSILPTPESQSASKLDLVMGPDLSVKGSGPYVELVVDGEIDRDKLLSTQHTEEWLLDKVRSLGGTGVQDVMYLGVNQQGEVLADLHRRTPHKHSEN